MFRTDIQHRCQRIAFHVAVVGQYTRLSRNDQRFVFVDAVHIIAAHRRIVDRGDHDFDHKQRTIQLTVTDAVGERVQSGVIFVGCVGKAPIGIEFQRAVFGANIQHRCQRITIHVTVVGQQPRLRCDNQRLIFRGTVGIVAAHGSIVDCGH